MSDALGSLDEIAAALPPDSWMLVGGLMVHAHSQIAGIPNSRSTDDADIVLEIGTTSYAVAAQALQSIGFEPHNPLDHREPSYRFN